MKNFHGHVARFAWAVLISFLLHLAFIGNLLDLQWGGLFPQSIVPAPLHVQLTRSAAAVPPPPSPEPMQPWPNKPLHKKPTTGYPPPPPIFQASTTISINKPAADSPQLRADAQLAMPEPTSVTPTSTEQSKVAPTPQLPPNGRLTYQFFWGKDRWMAGQAVHQWTIENGHYTLSSVVNTTGLFQLFHPTRLIESAKGIIAEGRLRPMEFSTQWNDAPPAVAIFDWNSNILRWTRGNTSYSQALPNNSYDKISYLYQLYLTPIKNRNLSAYITMGKLLEPYDIQNLGVEKIEIDEKIYPAIHIKRAESPANRENIDIWISTTLNNLPLKMIYSNNFGDHFEQLITQETLEEAKKQAH